MTTYNTIQDAFKNGTGDIFFIKEGKFIAVSRHQLNDLYTAKLINAGFDRLTYDDVIKLALKDNTTTSANIWASAIKQRIEAKETVSSYDNTSNGRDGYYDEFPDAYGQNL